MSFSPDFQAIWWQDRTGPRSTRCGPSNAKRFSGRTAPALGALGADLRIPSDLVPGPHRPSKHSMRTLECEMVGYQDRVGKNPPTPLPPPAIVVNPALRTKGKDGDAPKWIHQCETVSRDLLRGTFCGTFLREIGAGHFLCGNHRQNCGKNAICAGTVRGKIFAGRFSWDSLRADFFPAGIRASPRGNRTGLQIPQGERVPTS